MQHDVWIKIYCPRVAAYINAGENVATFQVKEDRVTVKYTTTKTKQKINNELHIHNSQP